eukprot:1185884-Prorocentrum_minimum.AAC.1
MTVENIKYRFGVGTGAPELVKPKVLLGVGVELGAAVEAAFESAVGGAAQHQRQRQRQHQHQQIAVQQGAQGGRRPLRQGHKAAPIEPVYGEGDPPPLAEADRFEVRQRDNHRQPRRLVRLVRLPVVPAQGHSDTVAQWRSESTVNRSKPSPARRRSAWRNRFWSVT